MDLHSGNRRLTAAVGAQQRAEGRYTIVPRTLIFLRRDESYLLIKGAASRRVWPGLYNGIGGHVDRGEDVFTSARRELMEEAGLEADLWLLGTIMVDAGPVGIGLFVFGGEVTGGTLRSSAEGDLEWVPAEKIHALPLVEDVAFIIERISKMTRRDPAFAGRSYYDAAGNLQIEFAS